MLLKALLIICTLIHDMVQATIITSYCLQAQLLQAHLMFLKERLLNRTITPLHWMRVSCLSPTIVLEVYYNMGFYRFFFFVGNCRIPQIIKIFKRRPGSCCLLVYDCKHIVGNVGSYVASQLGQGGHRDGTTCWHQHPQRTAMDIGSYCTICTGTLLKLLTTY